MLHGMRKPGGLKLRWYAAHLIYLNDYLSVFSGEKTSGFFCEMELNEILLNIMPNNWIKQAYVQGFYCESITFKSDVKIFERM